jgi:hypothetical protein
MRSIRSDFETRHRLIFCETGQWYGYFNTAYTLCDEGVVVRVTVQIY